MIEIGLALGAAKKAFDLRGFSHFYSCCGSRVV